MCSASLVTRNTQTRTVIRYHFITNNTSAVKRLTPPMLLRRCAQPPESSSTAAGNLKLGPSSSTHRRLPKRNKANLQEKTCLRQDLQEPCTEKSSAIRPWQMDGQMPANTYHHGLLSKKEQGTRSHTNIGETQIDTKKHRSEIKEGTCVSHSAPGPRLPWPEPW